MMRLDGEEFPAFEKLFQRKIHNLAGGHDGWIVVGGWERLAAAAAVVVVEGPSDAIALHPFVPDDHVVVTNICGAGGCPAVTVFRGKDVVVVMDADHPGENGARKRVHKLDGVAGRVRWARLPYEVVPTHGKDIRDFLNGGNGWAEVSALIDAAEVVEHTPASTAGAEGRPRIEVTPDEYVVISEAIEALAQDPNVFKRAGRLVHVVRESSDAVEEEIERAAGTPRIHGICDAYLRELLSLRCYFIRVDQDGELKHCPPPAFAVKAIHSRGFWSPVRRLSGITEVPILRPDGTVLDVPGWDAQTGLLYVPMGDIPAVAKNPSRDDALTALETVLDVVGDFPFASPAYQAAWLGGLLTGLARRTFTGPSPLFLFDANVRASGKSLLADIVGITLTGREMPRLSNPSNDDEARKRITSLAIAGDPLVLIDNIITALGGAALDAALTCTIWKDRRLGGNEIVELPLDAVWFATGNNVVLMTDTSRRVCHVRLESNLENPEERTGLRYPNLLGHVRARRQELIVAALTILRAFFVAGKPDMKLKPWGSFEGWSRVIRNTLVWLGLPDPGETRRELAEASDRDAGALRGLFDGWDEFDPEKNGFTSGEIVKRLHDQQNRFEAVRMALCELCGVADLTSKDTRKIGNQLKRFKGRVIGGRRLEMAIGRSRVNRWKVSGGSFGVSGESGESVLNPYARDSETSVFGDGPPEGEEF